MEWRRYLSSPDLLNSKHGSSRQGSNRTAKILVRVIFVVLFEYADHSSMAFGLGEAFLYYRRGSSEESSRGGMKEEKT